MDDHCSAGRGRRDAPPRRLGPDPHDPGDSKAIAYIGLVALILFATTVRGIWRWLVLVPTLYLAAFVWENVMSLQPDVTRYVLLGALLVAVMVIRPSGLLGERRVEIV